MESWLAKGASFSGNERNRVFLQRGTDESRRYHDISSISGLDSLGDGRAFAWLDFNRDGLRDVVVTNANEPRVQLFRNHMQSDNAVLALRLEGAHAAPEPSNRDGIGARIEVVAGGRTRTLELRAGEGLAAQNSSELLVGLGAATVVDAIRVFWPSGRRTVLDKPEIAPVGRTALILRESPSAR